MQNKLEFSAEIRHMPTVSFMNIFIDRYNNKFKVL